MVTLFQVTMETNVQKIYELVNVPVKKFFQLFWDVTSKFVEFTFNGDVDELQTWHKILTALTQRQQAYSNGKKNEGFRCK